MNDKLKENKCGIAFFCNFGYKNPCVYFAGKGLVCDYKKEGFLCDSAVANVNRLTIELKTLKGEI